MFITAVSGANFYSLINFWPLECQQIYGPDPHEIFRTVIPFGFSVAMGVVLVSWGLSAFRGANRELLTFSSSVMTAGIGALAAAKEDNRAYGIGMSVLGGFGVGGIIIPAAVILTIVSPDEVIATATAITFSVRLIGGSIGYAIYFNVFQQRLTDVLPTTIAGAVGKAGLAVAQIPALIEGLVAQNATAVGAVPGLTPAILLAADEAIKESYLEAFKRVYLVSIAFGVAAIIASAFLGNIKKYMINRVAVDIH